MPAFWTRRTLTAMRICAKTGCAREAIATCGFDYGERHAWLGPLGREPDPAGYDLCILHAERLRVPKGWTFADLRTPAIQPPERLPA